MNEEKVIKNHLKLNIGMHAAQIILFILTLTIFDWSHVQVEQGEGSSVDYHVTLMKVKTDFDYQDPIWLYTLTDDCMNQ
jgi:hypothetical protein